MPPAKKHIPLRMCSGCGEMFQKKELIRVVRAADGSVSLDLTGKKSGRGAYLCRSLDCFRKARKTRRMERSLGVSISEEVYDAMEQELNADG